MNSFSNFAMLSQLTDIILMQLLRKTVLAIAVLAIVHNTCDAQQRRYYKLIPGNNHPKWYGNGYYYGPDGGYASMKNGKGSKMYANDFCDYERTNKGVRTVFKRAKYAQDKAGRGYLYVAE